MRASAIALVALVGSACTPAGDDPVRWAAAPRAAPDFGAFAVREAAPAWLHEYAGKVVMLAFGYTACADICPTTLATMGRVLSHLGGDAVRVAPLYVSIDPERDAPEPFRTFLGAFDTRIEGLSVDAARLPDLLRAYDITATRRPVTLQRYLGHPPDPARDYSIDHTASGWGIDKRGFLRLKFAHDAPEAALTAAISKLVHE